MEWTDDLVAKAHKLVSDGFSRARVARKLSELTGQTVTRNMVHGKLERLRKKAGRALTKTARRKPSFVIGGGHSPVMRPATVVLDGEPVGKPLTDLDLNDCRWPSGPRGGVLFCGKPVAKPFSDRPHDRYCPEHRRRAVA